MRAAIKLLPTKETKRMQYLSIYNEVVSAKCRCGAPVAGASLDRTALRQFGEVTAGDDVEALVCCICACVHTRVANTNPEAP
eukprot:2518943-Amphidinium_carterae.1